MDRGAAQVYGCVAVGFAVLGLLAGLNVFEAVGFGVIAIGGWIALAYAVGWLIRRKPFSYMFLSAEEFAEVEREKREKEND